MASYGAPSGYPCLPSPTVNRWSYDSYCRNQLQLWIFKNKQIKVLKLTDLPTSFIRPDDSSSGSSLCTFFIDTWTSSSMCSMPTTLPLGPVCSLPKTKKKKISCCIQLICTCPSNPQKKMTSHYISDVPFLQNRRWDSRFQRLHPVQRPLELACRSTAPKHAHAAKWSQQETTLLHFGFVCE